MVRFIILLIYLGNASANSKGNGTVVVRGDLYIYNNITYQVAPSLKTKNLVSLGFIVIKDNEGYGGHIYIDPGVTQLAGTFYAEESISTGHVEEDHDVALRVDGAFISKQISFERQHWDAEIQQPAEQIIYDGRVLINTPPGMADVSKSLTRWAERE